MARHRWLATLLLFPLLQCSENSITAPGIPETARANAIRLHVDLVAKTVRQIEVNPGNGISLSLVGSDAVTVQATTPAQTSISQRKNLVRFDVAIVNALSGVTLIHPTQPTPPAGTTGLLLFPFQATATSGSGLIDPSTDWDGDPANFFNDANCKIPPLTDCYRYEEFAAPLTPGATSASRTVGFEVDKTVTAFDVVMLLAADLQNVAQAPASIVLSQSTADFQYSSGSLTPFPIAVTVSNGGGGSITGLTADVTYQQGQPSGWLSADLNTTTAPAVLSLRPSNAGLIDGTYNATVAVASAGVSNSPQNIAVTFTVSGSTSSSAIYVSQSDVGAIDDATCGLGPQWSGAGNHPCASITQGIARAVVIGRSEIRVADGRYTEAVTIVNGKNLLGGYEPDTWQRHLASTNTIIDGVSSSGNHDRTVIATGINTTTLFEGFVVRGATNSKASGNSYAMYLSASPGLTITRNVIYAGSGGPGTQGVAGSTPLKGADGTGRDSNNPAYDSKVAAGTGQCDVSNNRTYANGAAGTAGGDNISGGNGGGNTCPPSSTFAQQSAHDGIAGMAADGGAAGGTAGAGGYDYKYDFTASGDVCYVNPSVGSGAGGNGGNGANGQNGAAVAGGTNADGFIFSQQWVGAPGAAGNPGSNGGGGGGGGAGAGAYSMNPSASHDRLGGVGGGGGAGGVGGSGGGNGTAGGGSFGIYIISGPPTITSNTIIQGVGGNGGNGGAGGAGSLGGKGGAGGAATVFCTEPGGRGGDGGAGGIGSGGGGGAGGASFGIYTVSSGTPTYCASDNSNSITGGAGGSGGQGGTSLGNAGGAGVTGSVTACSYH